MALSSTAAGSDQVDLPVATHGMDAWASVVGKAISFGGKNQEQSLEALKNFQEKVMSSFQKQVSSCNTVLARLRSNSACQPMLGF